MTNCLQKKSSLRHQGGNKKGFKSRNSQGRLFGPFWAYATAAAEEDEDADCNKFRRMSLIHNSGKSSKASSTTLPAQITLILISLLVLVK